MKFYIKTYGCQMNLYDSELVSGILSRENFELADCEDIADIILITGCTVREHADQRALSILRQVVARKKDKPSLIVGLLGCLGQRVGPELQNTLTGVDLIMGPDAYRNLPFLLRKIPERSFIGAENRLEDYNDIEPLRKKGPSAWVAISRGCDNRCSYCIVPYMRGDERSRPAESIVKEVTKLVSEGFAEVTLLGQNVNSYENEGVRFPGLLSQVAKIKGIKRVRFTTSHPKDMSADLVYAVRDNEAVCNHVHLPVQSGSNSILSSMGREYTVERYKSLIDLMKNEISSITLTTDIISGFPGETEKDHEKTLDLVRYVKYDGAFTFKYSPREGTPAFELDDNVPEDVKIRRLNEIGNLQREITAGNNLQYIGKTVEVMIETRSKRSEDDALGKTEGFKNVIVADCDLPGGTFCDVEISSATSQTLFGSLKHSFHEVV